MGDRERAAWSDYQRARDESDAAWLAADQSAGRWFLGHRVGGPEALRDYLGRVHRADREWRRERAVAQRRLTFALGRGQGELFGRTA